MKKNTIVDTANNGQTTTENTVDNTSKLTKAERREQNYVAFRVNALKRRCKRYGLSEEKTNAYIEKLKELLASPNTYDIYVFFPQKDYKMISSIVNKHIDTKADGNIIMEYWMKFVGDNELLNKLREVLPDSAKIQPLVHKKRIDFDDGDNVVQNKKVPKKKVAKRKSKVEKRAEAKKKKSLADLRASRKAKKATIVPIRKNKNSGKQLKKKAA